MVGEEGSADARRLPPGVRNYVAAVSLAGIVGLLAVTALGPRGVMQPMVVVFLVGLMVVTASTPVRLQTNAGIKAFTLEVAVFIAAAFVLPIRFVPLFHVLSSPIGHIARRRDPVKVVFNAGMVGVVSALSILPFWAIGTGPDVFTIRSLLAASAAALTYEVANVLLLRGLFERLGSDHDGGTGLQAIKLHVTILLGNLTFGLVLAEMAMDEPISLLAAGLLMVGVFLGFRGYLGMLEDRERIDQLHEAAGSLASATGSDEALPRFVRHVAGIFGGERAEIVVIVHDAARHLLVDVDGNVVEDRGDRLSRVLDEALHGGRAFLRAELDAEAKHRDALAAPLVAEGRTVGAVAVYDRRGVEPWDETDVTLLSTLAHEAAVAVKNVELVTDLSEQTRKLGNIVSAASDGIALVDERGRIVTWNPAFERMAGRPSREVVGRPWAEAFPVEDERSREQLHRVMQAVLAGRPVDLPVDLQMARADDDHRWLRCTFAPVDPADAGADETGAVLIARDVTHERENEELKNDFLATVSHELRTPLTPLKGFLATAETHWDDLDREQLRTMVGAMRRQVDRLDALIADLLTVSDLDRRTIAFEGAEIDLSETVQDAIEMLPMAAAARVAFTAVPEVRAIGDQRAIQRVVRALTDNALKHTTGMVTVTVGHRGDEATVAVSDEGPGIREWDRDRIFERFGRLGDHLTRSQGPGLGLAIARSLAERLGGGLELESEVGSGSTFVLALPRSATIEAPAG